MEGSLLTSADLNTAQLYQIELGRRHRAGAHLAGVVDGLEIEKASTGLVLNAGYAVDEFGRDLVLAGPVQLDPFMAGARLDNPGADTFEVLLNYGQRPLSFGKGIDPSRLDETPQVEVRARIGAPDARLQFGVFQAAPDDPSVRRPVRIGVLRADPDKAGEWITLRDADSRLEAGLVAAAIVPDRNDTSYITLADGEFAVVLKSAVAAGAPQQAVGNAPDDIAGSKRLTVTNSGASFQGLLVVDGDVEVGSQLLLPTSGPAPAMADGCGLFRIGDSQAPPDTHEMRLVLPANGALSIGAWNQQSGKFEALLTIDAATRGVTIAGDLIIEGAFVEPVGQAKAGQETANAAQPPGEETTMLANLLAILLSMSKSVGKTAGGTGLLLVVAFLGVWWDAAAGMFPCDSVNAIRHILHIPPMLCHMAAPTTGAVAIVAGDASCTVSKSGTKLTDENGELLPKAVAAKQEEKPAPTEATSPAEPKPATAPVPAVKPSPDQEIAVYTAAIESISSGLNALRDTKTIQPTSIWIYCDDNKAAGGQTSQQNPQK
ncbi:hypothetical protein [Mesorhizobium sp. LSJC269B00]|uniref:hypothetical protein n=1 Tax=Mesorhizobium sp. LSJC269B00 TaxID=1287326 RepID=UPI0004249CA6|nr:hypothetical protein [Mesorhizobium sp. LSJC269B00]